MHQQRTPTEIFASKKKELPNQEAPIRISKREPGSANEPGFFVAWLRAQPRKKPEQGVALLLVLFIISIASIISVTLSYNVTLESRINQMVERSLQAEYYMKSALEFSRMMIALDPNRNADGRDDFWWAYSLGSELPLDLLGLEPVLGLKVYLEIAPVNRGVPINLATNPEWRATLLRLFESLGFDRDEEPNHLKEIGISEDRVFSPAEMVANLIDFLDADQESFSDPDFPATGIEAQLPQDYFPGENEVEKIDDLRELQRIPGFTPGRVGLLSNYVHTAPIGNVNLNVAPKLVIQSLDSGMSEAMAEEIFQDVRQGEGPFELRTPWKRDRLAPMTSSDISNKLGARITANSRDYDILCKVDFGESRYYMRARVVTLPSAERNGELPRVNSVEFFF